MSIDEPENECSLKTNQSKNYDISPVFSSEYIPLCFSIDENYAPMLSVVITSLIRNSNPCRNYDIIILEESLTDSTLDKLTGLSNGHENMSIRSFNVSEIVSRNSFENLMTRGHVTLAAYYRLFVGSIFKNYNRIIYLDSDILILSDLSELFDVNLDGHPCAAVLDVGVACFDRRGRKYRNFGRYMKDTLGVPDIDSYFNSGVMVFDLDEIRSKNYEARMIELAKLNNRYLHDQNVLNAMFYNNYKKLEPLWNYQWQIQYEFPEYEKRLSQNLLDSYNKARKSPKIVHYLSPVKPWNNNSWEYSDLYWVYANTLPVAYRPEKDFTKNTFFNELLRKSKKGIGDLRYILKTNSAVSNASNRIKNSRLSAMYESASSTFSRISHKINSIFKRP